MQDQDNIAQTDMENSETARETADVLTIPQNTSANDEAAVSENAADQQINPQTFQETPLVEFSGEQKSDDEIPTVTLNAQDIPENAGNDEFQTVQSLDVQDVPKEEIKEEPFMFNGYEVKNWEFNPRIYKILTGSTIFCVLALIAVGQSNVLNTRACDAPMVSKVCQVLDAVYVGSTLLGTDGEWVNKPYERTDLGDVDITYIDTSNVSPPLPYPEGYFALANPEMLYNDPMIIPGSEFPTADGFPPPTNFPPATNFPTSPNPIAPGNNPIAKTPVYPKPNKNKPTIPLPETGVVVEGDNPIGKDKQNGSQGFPNQNDEGKKPNEETANNNDKQPDIKSDAVDEVELNKKPIFDLGDFVKIKVNKDKVNLETPFVVQATGKLNKDGKIKDGSFKVIKAESTSKDMIAIVQRSIEAIDESGYLKYLEKLSGKDLNLLFTQDNEKIIAEVQSEMESDERARSIRSGIVLSILYMQNKKNKEIAEKTEALKTADSEQKIKLERDIQNAKDDLALLAGAKVEADGKKIIIRFNIKKDVAHPMIQRKLLAPRTTEDKPKSNSAAKTENDNSKAGK